VLYTTQTMSGESQRLRAGETALDRIVRLAARFLSCPIAVVSLVGRDRVFFESRYGTSCEGVNREGWFCEQTVLGSEPLVICDTALHPRSRDLPPFEDTGAIRFYAGAPVTLERGKAVGAVAVMDRRPREPLRPAETEALRDLAALAAEELKRRGIADKQPGGVFDSLGGIAGALPAMVWVTDTNGNCTLLNEFQWDSATLPERSDRDWLQIINPEEHDPEGKVDLNFECRVPGPNGEERWILEQARPRFHADGSFAGYIGLCLDITDRKRIEEALRETQEWLNLAQNAAGIGFWHWDIVNNTSKCSDQYYRLYGQQPGSPLTYESWSQQVHPDDRVSRADFEAQIAGKESFQREFRCVWPDGSVHWLVSRAKIFYDETGRAVRSIGANIDISSFKEAEERRDRAEKELIASREQLRQLAAHVESAREQERIRIAREVHDELGQILTVLKMDLEAVEVRYRASTPRPLRDITRRVASMLKNLDFMIGAVRRISSELRPGLLDHLGLAAAIEWQLQELESRTKIRCHTIGLPEELPLDAQQSTTVFRIFQEMLTNVVRHAGATAIRVRVQLEPARLVIEVVDNGKGFDPFRLKDPEALGLLGMRERALLLGGSIELESEAGKGTRITLRVPLSGV